MDYQYILPRFTLSVVLHVSLVCFSLQDKNNMGTMTLDSLRKNLVRQEDTIIFSLIERAKYPLNPKLYHHLPHIPLSGSIFDYIFQHTEFLQAKAGRYESPEENAFFPENLPPPMIRPYKYSEVLHPAGAGINLNKIIWDMYFNQLLPLFVTEGDDGNYVPTATSDIQCLQALSRRIHYGKFVAEVKFVQSPDDYRPAILTQDRDALMKLLTFETVEEMVKRRVEKKAMTFGQEVTLEDDIHNKPAEYKVDPSIVSRLYGEWVIPLTKLVQVEYLLRRLD